MFAEVRIGSLSCAKDPQLKCEVHVAGIELPKMQTFPANEIQCEAYISPEKTEIRAGYDTPSLGSQMRWEYSQSNPHYPQAKKKNTIS